MLSEKQDIYTLDEIYKIAVEYKKSGNYIKLNGLCAQTITYVETEEDDSKKVELFHLIGKIYSLYPNYPKAITWFSKSLEIQKNEITLEEVIKALISSQKYEEAINYSDEAIVLYKNNVVFEYLRSIAITQWCAPHLDKGEFNICISILERYSAPNDIVLVSKLTSFKAYCLANNLYYQEIQTDGQKNIIYQPNIFNGKKIRSQKNIEVSKLPIYIAEIPHASLLSGSNIVLVENNQQAIIDDAFFMFDRQRFHLDDPLRTVINGYSVPTNDILVRATPNNLSIESAIYIGGTYSFNFYHWIIEHLPTFWVISQLPQYSDLPILVDKGSIKHPNMLAMLKQVNITNREIIPVKAGHAYNINKLIVISKLAYVSPSVRDELKPTDVIIHREAVEFLRQIFFMPTQSKPNRLIFLGRKSSVAARISNQEEIQSVFSDYGFEIVYPEELHLEQSIELFSQAKIIAGATGAAMTNIIFAPKNTVVLCLLGENTANNTIFSNIAGSIGQQMIYILGKSNRDSAFSYHSSFRINPVDVLNCLNLILKKQGLRRDSN
jgi:tetratricopeptide (TPR) repeat protein